MMFQRQPTPSAQVRLHTQIESQAAIPIAVLQTAVESEVQPSLPERMPIILAESSVDAKRLRLVTIHPVVVPPEPLRTKTGC
tara:strand:+ start:1818 stop:2063 length:246 start_codon:yes stop_codon:yes gene_type:complete